MFSLKSDVPFEIIVYGTPAEEIGSGKVQLIEAGVFDDVDFCMMSHPAKYEIPQPKWIAIHAFTVVFTGIFLIFSAKINPIWYELLGARCP